MAPRRRQLIVGDGSAPPQLEPDELLNQVVLQQAAVNGARQRALAAGSRDEQTDQVVVGIGGSDLTKDLGTPTRSTQRATELVLQTVGDDR